MRRALPAFSVALVAMLSSCDQQPVPPSPDATDKPLPAYQASFLPPAVGRGNFEVCLSDEAADSGLKRVELPAGIIFQSFGQMTGNLRGQLNFDPRATSGANAAGYEGARYAVVLTKAVSLSTATPCARTDVEAVTNDGFRFTHDAVPVELHLNFQATGIFKTSAGGIDDDLKEPLLSATEGGFLVGAVVSDVTAAQSLRDK